ncbi:hypothetical protein AB7M75_005783 [Bradyrhizobium ottawaense]
MMKEFTPAPDSASIVSVTDRVKPVTLGMGVTSVHFLGPRAAFVGGEENVEFVDAQGEITTVAVHGGGILSTASDGKRLVMGGDDGKVVSLDAKGEVTLLATDPKRRWIDAVALHADGSYAWSAGKTAFVKSGKTEEKSLEVPSTVGGLAFAPKGLRLAIAHYNGATLWFPNMAGSAEFLPWAGSHLGVTFSPDNKFLVTTMHEAALHGWRLADNRHMRMTGYPGRVRSMSWSAGGQGAGDLGCRHHHPVAVRQQGRPDGQGARDAGAAAGAGLRGRLPSEERHPRRGLQRRHRADGAAGGWRGDPGPPQWHPARGRDRLERQGHAARLRR